ncbi:MAG TPA: DUF5691 domain-containing protein [Phototrophicaceae bacterium]|nr:DUF5691 domain-containing protein [Phototrophicaceae bacterium]
MWNELVTTALIGTERRAFTLDELPEALHELAAQLEGQDSERVLLTLAGTLALYRRAGQTPQIDPLPLPDPCPPDALPYCSPRAGQILNQILAISNYSQHLPVWIAAAYNAHQRITPEYLPRFLSSFEKNQHLPDHFYDVLGARGRWLAQQNPAWAYAVLPENDAEWELANIHARVHVLRQLRASDPAHARALVESVWSSEKAETRAALLGAYEIDLNLDDEPLLETALDDRAEAVRKVAAWLLARLAGSAYQQRMIARAQLLIHVKRGQKLIGSKLEIEITLPDAYDESMIRDGIPAEAPQGSNLPDRVYWLANLAARLPASYWLSDDWSARELVEAVNTNHNWRGILLDCLVQMAEREDQHDFADALLDTEIENAAMYSALRAASPAAREAYALEVLQPDMIKDTEALKRLSMLGRVGHQWSTALTRAFLAMARKEIKASAGVSTPAASYLPQYVMHIPLACIEDLRASESADEQKVPLWSRAVKQAIAMLEFRQKMLKEFSK